MASTECTKGGLNALKATQLYKADEFWGNVSGKKKNLSWVNKEKTNRKDFLELATILNQKMWVSLFYF